MEACQIHMETLTDGFGLPQMMLIVAMMGFALWKQGWLRAITSVGLVIWGAYTMQYDIKVAAPLIGIGTLLFFDAILRLLRGNTADG